MNRILCTALLLIVIAGYAMGTTHAAVHVSADPGDCALCATYGGSAEAIPASGQPVLPVAAPCDLVDLPIATKSGSAAAHIHPRGPPCQSS